jgi:peptidoglycan hydrolase CwlO-like protein
MDDVKVPATAERIKTLFARLMYITVMCATMLAGWFCMGIIVTSEENSRKQAESTKSADYAEFVRLFEIPATPVADKDPESDMLAIKIREAKIKGKLLAISQDLVTKHEQLKSLRNDVDENTNIEEQVKKISALKQDIQTRQNEFLGHARLASRFSGFPSDYGDISRHCQERGNATSWPWVIEKIKSVGSFPLF